MDSVIEYNKSDLTGINQFLKENNLPCLLKIHGFLSAIASGPNSFLPSEWIEFLRLNDGDFKSVEQAESVFETVIHMYNDILDQLSRATFIITNINKNASSVETFSEIKIWAQGYILGMSCDRETWMKCSHMTKFVCLILAAEHHGDELLLAGFLKQSRLEQTIKQFKEDRKQVLEETVILIYQYWLQYRADSESVNHLLLNKKINMNDLCICGSGKKYKKCCLRSH